MYLRPRTFSPRVVVAAHYVIARGNYIGSSSMACLKARQGRGSSFLVKKSPCAKTLVECFQSFERRRGGLFDGTSNFLHCSQRFAQLQCATSMSASPSVSSTFSFDDAVPAPRPACRRSGIQPPSAPQHIRCPDHNQFPQCTVLAARPLAKLAVYWRAEFSCRRDGSSYFKVSADLLIGESHSRRRLPQGNG